MRLQGSDKAAAAGRAQDMSTVHAKVAETVAAAIADKLSDPGFFSDGGPPPGTNFVLKPHLAAPLFTVTKVIELMPNTRGQAIGDVTLGKEIAAANAILAKDNVVIYGWRFAGTHVVAFVYSGHAAAAAHQKSRASATQDGEPSDANVFSLAKPRTANVDRWSSEPVSYPPGVVANAEAYAKTIRAQVLARNVPAFRNEPLHPEGRYLVPKQIAISKLARCAPVEIMSQDQAEAIGGFDVTWAVRLAAANLKNDGIDLFGWQPDAASSKVLALVAG